MAWRHFDSHSCHKICSHHRSGSDLFSLDFEMSALSLDGDASDILGGSDNEYTRYEIIIKIILIVLLLYSAFR